MPPASSDRHHSTTSTKKTAGGGARGQGRHHTASNRQSSASGNPDGVSSGDDSYVPNNELARQGAGGHSEVDERDSAFDGNMEYQEEEARGAQGDEYDVGSDAHEVTEDKAGKRHRDFQDRLLKLELEFEDNKNTIYAYQMARYKEELEAIFSGAHPDFHDKIVDLEETRDSAIEKASLYRDYQNACAQQAYEAEIQNAEEEYMTEREGLREKMLADVEAKRRALREDKENLDIGNDFAIESTTRPHHTRKLRKRGQDTEPGNKGTKRKASQPAGARWQAPESDAMDDMAAIRKVVSSGTVKKQGASKKK
ncbi:histone deacetylase and transcriptional regulator [Actinomortierella ambigua]|nr:histone deacetylase and transcriptional regulator [Actinomortierella ambigua]